MTKKRNGKRGLKKGLLKQSEKRPAKNRTVSKRRVFSDKLDAEGRQEMRELRKILRGLEKAQILSMEWQVKQGLRRLREASQMFLFAGREDPEMRKETLLFLRNAEGKVASEFALLKAMNAEAEANRRGWESRPPVERLAFLRAQWETAQEFETKKREALEQKRQQDEARALEEERKQETLQKRLQEWRRNCEIAPAESLEQVRKEEADLQERISAFMKEREEISRRSEEINAQGAKLVDEFKETQEKVKIAEEIANAGQVKSECVADAGQAQSICTGKDLQNNSKNGKCTANAEHMQKRNDEK